jgi:hypothetical protein
MSRQSFNGCARRASALVITVTASFALIACGNEGDNMSAAGSSAPFGGTGGMSPFGGSGGAGGTMPMGGAAGMNPLGGTGAGVGGMMVIGGMTGGTAGMDPVGGGGAGGMMPSGDPPPYHDPGTGPWEMGSAEECKMDTSLITGSDNLAVFRYGKLCHVQGGNTSGANWSVTKTLGGVLAGRAAYLVKDVARTGPGTGPILHEDKVTDWIATTGYSINSDALLSHVMAMAAYNSNLAYGSKAFSYDTLGTREISAIVDVAMVAVEQLGGSVPTSQTAFMDQEVFGKLGITDSNWPGGTIGYGWSGTLEDMGRVGVMLVHDGWYGGERFMEASWVYRMSHPSH